MKIEVLYEVVKTVAVEVPDELIANMDLSSIWDYLPENDDIECGNIIAIADANSEEILYE